MLVDNYESKVILEPRLKKNKIILDFLKKSFFKLIMLMNSKLIKQKTNKNMNVN